MATEAHPKNLTRWLLDQWRSRFGQSIESMTAGSYPVEAGSEEEPAKPPTGEAGFLGWRQTFSLTSEAGIWVGASRGVWAAIGDAVLKAAGIEDASEEDQKGSYLEILNQALSGLGQSITGLAGREILCANGQESTAVPAGEVSVCRIVPEEGKPWALFVGLEPGFLAAMEGLSAAGMPEGSGAAAGGSEASGGATEAPETGRTIDLIYDVELPLSVSFGRAHMPLKEVLKLTSGSIVELNRAVTEPVEVIVNNCVIARGEVVVVDGNYGIRIVQIISRRERLRTLH